jgi:prepilin-type N-terminal cleavage/methylation domain-containing protein
MYIPETKSGFTLVEMIVSLAIFSIVAVVALGALVKVIGTNKKAQTLQDAITNMSFSLDSMQRELLTGSYYHCSVYDGLSTFSPGNSSGTHMSPTISSCPSGTNLIAFESTNYDPSVTPPSPPCPLVYAYFFSMNDNSLKKAQQTHCSDVFDRSWFQSVTPPNVYIATYNLSITNLPLSVNNLSPYPLAFIRLSGFAGVNEIEKNRTYFDLQTAVSPRTPYPQYSN